MSCAGILRLTSDIKLSNRLLDNWSTGDRPDCAARCCTNTLLHKESPQDQRQNESNRRLPMIRISGASYAELC